MEKANEQLLDAWLKLSTSVVNNRIVSELSFNESLVCNILYKRLKQNSGDTITATQLCNETKILKSQMNRILNQLESKNIIVRERSTEDKRQVFVKMNINHLEKYEKQHANILKIVDLIIGRIGIENTKHMVENLNVISELVDQMIEANKENE